MAKKKLLGDKLKKQISDNLRYYEKQGRDTSEYRSRFKELQESFKSSTGATKAAITRALNKLKSDISSSLSEFSKHITSEEKAELREQTRRKRETDFWEKNQPSVPSEYTPDYISPPAEDYITIDASEFDRLWLEYQGILDRIKGAPKEQIIHDMFSSEIRQFGFEKVIKAIGQIPSSYIQDLEWAAFVPSDSPLNLQASRTIKKFAEVIKGTILSFDELKSFSEAAESEDEFGPTYE